MKIYNLNDRWDLIDYLIKREGFSENRKARIILKNFINYVLKVNNNYNNYIVGFLKDNSKVMIEASLYNLMDLIDLTLEELIENNLLIETEE